MQSAKWVLYQRHTNNVVLVTRDVVTVLVFRALHVY